MSSLRPRSSGRPIILAAGIAGLLVSGILTEELRATDGSWTVNANGNWTATGSWTGGVIPTGTDGTATFGFLLTANRTVTVDTGRTIGNLTFNTNNNSTFSYTLSGGSLILSTTSPAAPTITVQQGTGIISTPITSTVGFTKSGTGTLRLSGNNTGLTGTISVTAGSLRVDAANAFNGQTITETADNTTIYFSNNASFASNLNILGYGVSEGDTGDSHLGGIRIATAGANLTGTITLQGNSGITPRGTGTTGGTVSGKITGGFELRLGRTSTSTGASTGTITLTNPANDWSGGSLLHDGTVKLGATGVIPNGASAGNVTLDNLGVGFNASIADTVLDLNGNSEQINGLSHATAAASVGSLGKLRVTNTGTAATFTVGDNDAAGNYGGIVEGAVTFSKIGAAKQVLSGANTYTGGTSINAGILAINNTAGSSGTGTGAVSVLANGTLSGTGFIVPGSGNGISVASSGIIAPGDGGVGTLTFDGSANATATLLSLTSGARFVFEIGTTVSDKITFLSDTAGDVAFNIDTISFADTSGGLLAGGAPIVLFDGSADSTYTGLSFGGTDPTEITGGLTIESPFLLQYPGSHVNLVNGDILLTVVPEPSAAVSLLGGAGLLSVLRRRRRDR